MASILSVNTGRVEPFVAARARYSAIVKTPVDGAVRIEGVHVGDDEQADRRHHGGADQAAYAYSRESYEWWEHELGRSLDPGLFGENLTTTGIDVDGALIGERWRVGSALLEVTAPRIACLKFAKRMDEPDWIKRFAAGRRPGAYLRIIEPGDVRAGDPIDVVARPPHDVTIALLNEVLLHDRGLAPRLRPAAAALPAKLRGLASRVDV